MYTHSTTRVRNMSATVTPLVISALGRDTTLNLYVMKGAACEVAANSSGSPEYCTKTK